MSVFKIGLETFSHTNLGGSSHQKHVMAHLKRLCMSDSFKFVGATWPLLVHLNEQANVSKTNSQTNMKKHSQKSPETRPPFFLRHRPARQLLCL